MIISYDNLITRLWLSGAILPYERGGYASALPASIDGGDDLPGRIDTMIDEKGLPPVPHQYWVDRLGFQQDDPVTDFRSGGVSSVLVVVGENMCMVFVDGIGILGSLLSRGIATAPIDCDKNRFSSPFFTPSPPQIPNNV
jgi:hypothetical protein